MLGERAGASRPGKHASQVQHPHRGERPQTNGEWFWFCFTNFPDLKQRLHRHSRRLRMLRPFGGVARQARAAPGGVDRVFERGPVPGAARCLGGGTVWHAASRHAEHSHRGVAMVRKIAVDADPAPALHGVVAAQRIPGGLRRLAVDPEVVRTAQRSGGGPHIDCHVLQPARFQAPEIRHRQSHRAQCRGARGPYEERRGEHRIAACKRNLLRRRSLQVCEGKQLPECIADRHGNR